LSQNRTVKSLTTRDTRSTNIDVTWLSLLGAGVGIAGTLAGVAMTQRNANRREDLRWDRETARLQDETQHRREEEHAAWLRHQRLEAYVQLTKLSQDFWMRLVPRISVLERQDDPASDLNRIRLALFATIDTCRLIAGPDLQVALYELSDATENVGHRPYAADPARESIWCHALLDDSQNASQLVEHAVRGELNLPSNVPYQTNMDDRRRKASGTHG
jgi:hypothetical protein